MVPVPASSNALGAHLVCWDFSHHDFRGLRRLRLSVHGPTALCPPLPGVPRLHIGRVPRGNLAHSVQHASLRSSGEFAGALGGDSAVCACHPAVLRCGVRAARRAGICPGPQPRASPTAGADAVRHRLLRRHFRPDCGGQRHKRLLLAQYLWLVQSAVAVVPLDAARRLPSRHAQRVVPRTPERVAGRAHVRQRPALLAADGPAHRVLPGSQAGRGHAFIGREQLLHQLCGGFHQ
mmetsp:Transcript_28413/g.54155  ORF Transcript_28413/g.54155 Transcript_28413/m.54155 type:complete len:235 (+) Transcript_28413:154-858(+)